MVPYRECTDLSRALCHSLLREVPVWVLPVTDVSVFALLGFEMGLGRVFGFRDTAFLVGETASSQK